MITYRKCFNCGWVCRHPILWCANCGSRLRPVKGKESDYYSQSKAFHEKTGWDWSKAQYDIESGEKVEIEDDS